MWLTISPVVVAAENWTEMFLKRKHGIRLRKPHSLLYLLQFEDRVVKVMN